ncbi:hypothetical protein [Paenibacillus qinlingensis]|uniref:hypothetical protein n=1 Tax=Paenibacillus qinlingensis TaxID=1837343 RepID=UPI0015647A8D|nr:hypothetical protein [Paenibacillus qinlingensis]NQX63266.1 hypothetical protein [Paenibacillus qinlingensis]
MYTCLICGYDDLNMPQYTPNGEPMFNICPCCGFQSGFDDAAIAEPLTIVEYRIQWVKLGAPWFSSRTKKPDVYNLQQQLKRINVKLEDIY